jgi:uncharacterized membrane protein YtjA (UPF0391 family)
VQEQFYGLDAHHQISFWLTSCMVKSETMIDLIGLAVVFLVIALVAYAVGARGIAGFSMEIAKILIIVFVALFLLALVFGVAIT